MAVPASPATVPLGAVARPLVLASALAALVLGRSAATTWIASDGIAVGVGFGLGLAALAIAAGGMPWTGVRGARTAAARPGSIPGRANAIDQVRWRLRGRAHAIPIAIGLAGALPLVVIALVASGPAIVMFGSGAPFLPWAAATVLVATTEEFVLRGALFAEVDRLLGGSSAVVITSVVFALMHVPMYGWHVVPLDLGVGFWLAGLRLVSGGVAAPAVAHVAADIVTWWL